jgi:transposase
MSSTLRKKYDSEFKASAVELVQRGKRIKEVAQDLGITNSLLSRWRREYLRDQEHAFPGHGYLKPEDQLVRDLKRQLRDVTEERDILKKALAVFSRTSK